MDDDENARARRARMASPFLDTKQAAHFLVLSPKTLANMRWRDSGPRFRKHGRFVRYHIDDLERWSLDNRGGRRDA